MLSFRRVVGLLFALLFVHTISYANDTVSVSMRDVRQKSGFTWSAGATLTSNYIWRGLYVGGLSLQVDATVGYKGLFANVWWNVGVRDWTCSTLNPEVDFTIGYSRWGLTVLYLHMYYFDRYADGTMSKYFDFKNHVPGGGGTTGEWRVSYRVSDLIPLSCLVAVRTFGRDGYYEVKGGLGDEATLELKRAYSTYIELGYDFDMGDDWMLTARVGVTPAKSLYTGYQGNFAVTLVGLKLNKSWDIGEKTMRREGDEAKRRAGRLNAFAHVMLQPWQVTKENLIRPIEEAGNQKLNLAIGVSYGI